MNIKLSDLLKSGKHQTFFMEFAKVKAKFKKINWISFVLQKPEIVQVFDGDEYLELKDILLIDHMVKNNLTYDDFDYSMVVCCDVCNKLCMPDDEAYNCDNTNTIVCDEHTKVVEVPYGYVRSF